MKHMPVPNAVDIERGLSEKPVMPSNASLSIFLSVYPQQCGLSGSPTKVKAVKNIVFQAKESKTLTGSDADVEGLIKEVKLKLMKIK